MASAGTSTTTIHGEICFRRAFHGIQHCRPSSKTSIYVDVAGNDAWTKQYPSGDRNIFDIDHQTSTHVSHQRSSTVPKTMAPKDKKPVRKSIESRPSPVSTSWFGARRGSDLPSVNEILERSPEPEPPILRSDVEEVFSVLATASSGAEDSDTSTFQDSDSSVFLSSDEQSGNVSRRRENAIDSTRPVSPTKRSRRPSNDSVRSVAEDPTISALLPWETTNRHVPRCHEKGNAAISTSSPPKRPRGRSPETTHLTTKDQISSRGNESRKAMTSNKALKKRGNEPLQALQPQLSMPPPPPSVPPLPMPDPNPSGALWDPPLDPSQMQPFRFASVIPDRERRQTIRPIDTDYYPAGMRFPIREHPLAEILVERDWTEPREFAFWRYHLPSPGRLQMDWLAWEWRLARAIELCPDWPLPLPYEPLKTYRQRVFLSLPEDVDEEVLEEVWQWRERNDRSLRSCDNERAEREFDEFYGREHRGPSATERSNPEHDSQSRNPKGKARSALKPMARQEDDPPPPLQPYDIQEFVVSRLWSAPLPALRIQPLPSEQSIPKRPKAIRDVDNKILDQENWTPRWQYESQPHPASEQLEQRGWHEPTEWEHWRTNLPTTGESAETWSQWHKRLARARRQCPDFPLPLPYEDWQAYSDRSRGHWPRGGYSPAVEYWTWREANDRSLRSMDERRAMREHEEEVKERSKAERRGSMFRSG